MYHLSTSWCPQICFIRYEIACRNVCAQLKSETVLAFGVVRATILRTKCVILMATEKGKVFVFHPRIKAKTNYLQEILASSTQEKYLFSANNPLSSLLMPLQMIAHWEYSQGTQNLTLQPLQLGVGRWQSGLKAPKKRTCMNALVSLG